MADNTPPKASFPRRNSLSLSQSLSLDWTPPPPPADLKRIHADSLNAPGLTTFSLGSPPAGNNEGVTFNKIYSRVKSIANSVIDAVGPGTANSNSPTPRSFLGLGGNDDDRPTSRNKDDVQSLNSDFRPRSPPKPFSPNAHLNQPNGGSLHSGTSSRISSHLSLTDLAPPLALRKSSLLGAQRKAMNPAVTPLTVERHGVEVADGYMSAGISRSSSPFPDSLRGEVASSDATHGAGAGSTGREPMDIRDRGATSAHRGNDAFVNLPSGYESASDETLSDSSDDDVVMLHSKLPGTARPRTKPTLKSKHKAKKTVEAPPQKRDPKLNTNLGRPDKNIPFLPPTMAPEPSRNPSLKSVPAGQAPFSKSAPSDTSLPRLARMDSDGAESRIPAPQSRGAAESSVKRRPSTGTRTASERFSLLPSFRISRTQNTTSGPTDIVSTTSSNRSAEGGRTASGSHGGGLAGSTEAVSQALRQLRSGNLTRDFWMKDELCKECFVCGSAFSAWRRKHHCRLCGQIFCSKCTTLISGDQFGHQGSMRVCKPCLHVVNEYEDDSDSDDFSPAAVFGQPPSVTSESPKQPKIPVRSRMDGLRPGQTPLMAIPASRITAANNPNRRSQILEIGTDLPSTPRPQSVRSVNALSRPLTAVSSKGLLGSSALNPHSHKHTRSHHHLFPAEDRVPFHRTEDKRQSRLLPAFHADSVLDPDVAPYLSDDDSDDEQQLSIFATIAPRFADNEANSTAMPETGASTPTLGSNWEKGDRPSNSNSARIRRAKSRSRGSISGINAVLAGGDAKINQRNGRRRGHSFINPLQQQRPVTRGRNRGIMSSLSDSIGRSGIPVAAGSPRSARTSARESIQQVELNTASLQHVKKMLNQLLTDSGVTKVAQWEQALLPILLKSTDDLNPDVRGGDNIDIRHYVKIKRIPGGRPSDTNYVSGVVFSKNLTLKSMPRHITNPRIVVISFPIEYQRHQMQLMSLEPVIAQEKEYLQNLVNRIIALRPTLLLVESNVSGLALQLLAQANIATAHLVKPSVIEAVSRCAQADIFTSVDKLALSHFRLGKCADFDVKTFVADDIPNRKKTFMFLSGCQKELGCTIILRGSNMQELEIVKRITELMVYVVYNLKLETCLMRDEFLIIPSTPTGPQIAPTPTASATASAETSKESSNIEEEKAKAPAADETEQLEVTDEKLINVETEDNSTDPEKAALESREKETEANFASAEAAPISEPERAIALADDKLPADIPNPTYYEDMVRKQETKILSASPFVSYMQPYLLTRARGLERRLVYLRRLRDSLPVFDDETEVEKPGYIDEEVVIPEVAQDIAQREVQETEKLPVEEVPDVSDNFQLVDPKAVHGEVKQATRKATEVLRAIYDAEYDKALHVYETQKRQWENYLQQYTDLFDPFAHQSITVLYSMVCTATSVPCEGPDILRLEFYYQDQDWPVRHSDCSLGQFIEYLCETADFKCGSKSCEKKMIEHHRSYVHGQARVSVLVSSEMVCPIEPAGDNQILMWSYCNKKECPGSNTPAIPMSESTWKYSFGKYLELSFWSSEMKMRGAGCPHDTNRDQVKCFGYQGLTVVFQYDEIDLLEIVVPRTKITFQPEIDLRIKNEQFTQHEERINRFFASVKNRLNGINTESVPNEKQTDCAAEIQSLKVKAAGDHAWLIAKLQEKYNKSKYHEIIPLNRALRALQEKVVEWDGLFAGFDRNYFPSEKDIRRLATLQLKKIFMDDSSASSLKSGAETPQPTEDGPRLDSISTDGASPETSVGSMSSEQAHDVLAAVVEEDQEANGGKEVIGDSTSSLPQESSNTATDVGSIQELTSPDDETPKQEITQEEAEDPVPRIPIAHSLPVSPIISADISQFRPLSKDTIPEGWNPLDPEPTSPKQETAHPRTPAVPVPSRLPIATHSTSGLANFIKPSGGRKLQRPGMNSRTTSSPEAPRRKDPIVPVQLFDRGRSPTLPIKKTTERIRAIGAMASEKIKKLEDKKLDRFRGGSGPKKPKEMEAPIPRSNPSNLFPTAGKRNTKVTTLAKHWEQLSKEFQREREKEKKLLANRRPRALPVATSRPIVEVYKNVDDAVEEHSDEDEAEVVDTPRLQPAKENSAMTEGSSGDTFKTISPVISRDQTFITANSDEPLEEETPSVPPPASTHSQSDVDVSDGELSLTNSHDHPPVPNIEDVLPQNIDEVEELPQHNRSAWMKLLTTFWAERSATGWTSLDYPLLPTDHVFNDSDIIVREDEPSSLIAFTLMHDFYVKKLQEIHDTDRAEAGDNSYSRDTNNPDIERALLKSTGTHLKYQFTEGTARFFCKIFYAEQFDALRRNCGIADRFVESLSRCTKWDSKGGKSRSVFLKSMDERIVLKSLSPVETAAFIKFAPVYFQFMSEAFFHELPTVIAKMLGFYQISIRNPATGTELKWDILVMENLFYDRKMSRIFDLKGSMRNRYTQATGDQNEVLLDENMVEYIYESPLFVREHSKKLLRASLWNDTLFLSRQNVMDYSLMIGIDDDRKELVVGIIDCIRTFTWDKKLESWVKERGLAGGGRNKPTVTSPREYKHRFREAMERYVLEAPSCWHLTGLNAMGAVKVNLQTPTAQQMSGNATEKAGLQQQGRAPAVLDGVDGNHGMGVQEGVAES